MNTRKTIFVIGGLAIILLLLAVRLGWLGKAGIQRSKEKSPAEVRRSAASPAEKKTKATIKTAKSEAVPPAAVPAVPKAEKRPAPVRTEDQALGAGDPFAYAAAASGDYTPLSGSKNVGVITVKGIIRMAGEEPKAILHLKDTDRVHYVSKNSVVRVSAKNKNGNLPTEAYIVVKDIRNDEVELIQLERPDKVIIIR